MTSSPVTATALKLGIFFLGIITSVKTCVNKIIVIKNFIIKFNKDVQKKENKKKSKIKNW